MAKYKVLVNGVKIGEKDGDITTSIDVEAVGVYTNGEWVTFHSAQENFTNNVVAAFPTHSVMAIQKVET